MSITERLANLSIPWVLAIIAVLLALRFVLRKQNAPLAKSTAEVLESLAVAMALVFLLIRPFVVQAFFIPSGSMEPTLLENDHILVNKFIYRVSDPKHEDVVVFKSPPSAEANEVDFIKRVIGVPGDVVRITQGYVTVDGEQYNHGQLRELLSAPDDTNPKVKLVGKNVFVDGKKLSYAEIAAGVNQPNAKVKVVPGEVYINGKAANESYTAEDPDKPYPMPSTLDQSDIVKPKNGKWEIKVPKGKLLVMGDNRNFSNDARYWGLLDRSRIQGKAMFVFWPLGRIKWIH